MSAHQPSTAVDAVEEPAAMAPDSAVTAAAARPSPARPQTAPARPMVQQKQGRACAPTLFEVGTMRPNVNGRRSCGGAGTVNAGTIRQQRAHAVAQARYAAQYACLFIHI